VNRDVKTRWLEALRSGEYAQDTGMLHRRYGADDVDSYCCLGVLCALAERAGVVERYAADGSFAYRSVVNHDDRSSNFLPLAVRDWAGLDRANPVVDDVSLSSHNDDELNFNAIADLIEEHL
jgi:hypothetical protein